MTDSDTVIKQTRPLDDGYYIALEGEVDLSRSPALRNELMQVTSNQPKQLVVDLAEVTYMDSSGVATLVEALQKMRQHGGEMRLCRLQPRVRSIFEIARLDTVFTIADECDVDTSE